jgi:hypothetical protein
LKSPTSRSSTTSASWRRFRTPAKPTSPTTCRTPTPTSATPSAGSWGRAASPPEGASEGPLRDPHGVARRRGRSSKAEPPDPWTHHAAGDEDLLQTSVVDDR